MYSQLFHLSMLFVVNNNSSLFVKLIISLIEFYMTIFLLIIKRLNIVESIMVRPFVSS